MSRLLLNEVAEPSTPAAGKGSLYLDSADRYLKLKDSKGLVGVIGDHELWNFARNSGFWFAQRQAPATLTTYSNIGGRIIAGADGWGISNENTSTQYRRVDTTGAAESGLQGRFWGEYTKITSVGKIVVVQVIEGSDAQALRGRTVRVGFWAKAIIGTPITLKLGLLNWTGTVDVVPSGAGLVFSAFGANGVDPTLAASFAYLAPKSGVTPDNGTAVTNNVTCNVTTTWQRFSAVFDVPTTCRNLILMIHSDNQIATTNGYALSQISLTDGFEIQNWSPLNLDAELNRVQRFYCKTFNLDTNPATNPGALTGETRIPSPVGASTAFPACWTWEFPVRMRVAPTLTLFNPQAANAQVRNQTLNTDCTASAASADGEKRMLIAATTPASTVAGTNILGVHVSADAEL